MVLRTCNAAPSGARSGAGGGGSIHNQLYNWLCIYYSVLPGIVNRGQAALGNFFAPAHPEGATAFPCHPTPPVPGILPASSRHPPGILPASFRACHPGRFPVPVILRVFLPLSSWASSCPSHPGSFPASVILNLPGPCSSRQLRPCHPECLSPCHSEPPQPCHPERSEGSSLIPLQARRGNRRRGGKILRRCAPQDDRGATDAPRADKRGGRHPLRRQKARLTPLGRTKGTTDALREDKREKPPRSRGGDGAAGKRGGEIRPSGTPDRPPWASGPGR